MSNILQSLNNIRTLRAQARELALEELTDILEKFTAVVDERKQEEESNAEAERARNEKLEKFRSLLADAGITAEELVGTTPATKARKTRAPRPAKYKYVDENGDEKTWTGQGRTPAQIRVQLESGKKLEDFLI